MKTFALAARSILALSTLLFSKNAAALSVPDTGNCNSATTCLALSQAAWGYAAIAGDGYIGVQGTTATDNGYAVAGLTSNSGAIGVYGSSSGSGGNAVYGTASSSGTAIVGINSGGTAGWFTGNVYYTGTLSQWSDARMKKDVKQLSYGLDDVLKLRPVIYKWKRDDGDKTHLGLIAQEVEKVIPEVVSTVQEPKGTPDPAGFDIKTVSYAELVPMLIKAVQDQQKIIAKQDARIAALERGRTPVQLSSMLFGGAALLPIGLVFASKRRKNRV